MNDMNMNEGSGASVEASTKSKQRMSYKQKRQAEELVNQGISYKEIADRLGVGQRQVDYFVKNDLEIEPNSTQESIDSEAERKRMDAAIMEFL